MTKTEWENWRKLCEDLLKSPAFKRYEEAQKSFFESEEFREYVKAENRVDDTAFHSYLEEGAEPIDEMHGTPKFLRWIYEQYKDLDRKWGDEDWDEEEKESS